MKKVIAALCLIVLPQFAQALPIPLDLFRESEPRALPSQIPHELNGRVNRWIQFFTIDDRARFDRFMSRGALYKTLIQDILIENGVPPEMYYLAMIESGFSRGIRSRASAVGTWQFMPGTAREYGLRVNREVDERLDIIRSTRAAAHFLRDLKNELGSWYLAMAAYNCGAGCVRSAINRAGTRDFWRLARMRALPEETINYIPKFQAAMMIAKRPERYGFRTKIYYDFPRVQRVVVPGGTHLLNIARQHKVSIHALLSLNPHLLRQSTPTSRNYVVYVPKQGRRRS